VLGELATWKVKFVTCDPIAPVVLLNEEKPFAEAVSGRPGDLRA